MGLNLGTILELEVDPLTCWKQIGKPDPPTLRDYRGCMHCTSVCQACLDSLRRINSSTPLLPSLAISGQMAIPCQTIRGSSLVTQRPFKRRLLRPLKGVFVPRPWKVAEWSVIDLSTLKHWFLERQRKWKWGSRWRRNGTKIVSNAGKEIRNIQNGYRKNFEPARAW